MLGRLQVNQLFKPYTSSGSSRYLYLSSRNIMSSSISTENKDEWKLFRVPKGKEAECWVQQLDLKGAKDFSYKTSSALEIQHAPRILVLYGSLRQVSFSRNLAYECARLLEYLGAEVRVYNPDGLPVRNPSLEENPKVQELRSLVEWSEGHVWVSPEMHGQITGVMKNQIDWIPLNTGSVRPTQGKTVAVMQVNGGSQSFNAVNSLRLLARWMRMPCCTNQSSVPKAWTEFEENGRMKPSDYRNRVVDVMEEFYKFTLIMREHAEYLVDRFSEREEKKCKGRLLSQAEKEAQKDTKSNNS
jgi:arsenic resistance protein ArsH